MFRMGPVAVDGHRVDVPVGESHEELPRELERVGRFMGEHRLQEVGEERLQLRMVPRVQPVSVGEGVLALLELPAQLEVVSPMETRPSELRRRQELLWNVTAASMIAQSPSASPCSISVGMQRTFITMGLPTWQRLTKCPSASRYVCHVTGTSVTQRSRRSSP